MEERQKISILNLFFYLVIIEIVIGGSGRLIEFGLLSLKMLLYIGAIFISFFSLKKIQLNEVFHLQIIFLLLLCLGFAISAFNDAKVELILEDIKPLTFMFMASYFAINIKSKNNIRTVSFLIKYSSLLMGIVYILIVIGLHLGVINFSVFYQQQSENSEIFFRGDKFFFYKGFLYLGVGFIFFVTSKSFKDQIFAFILFTALCLTLTRGFILAASLVYLYYIFFVNKGYFLKFLALILSFISLTYLLPILLDTLGNKSDSDLVRFLTFDEVIEDINFFSAIFGHGFGIGVESRPIHMEISFLEIFHKQGIIGLIFWFGLLTYLIVKFKAIKLYDLKIIGLPYLLSVFFVYIQSFTNPFVNNPIGISILTIAFIVILRLNILSNNQIKHN
ncbi:hypothetical protein [Sphingobacterium multivorum]|uniref:hypothetical protein n=1 Tax=Sphingobacterium multivorum TaxID=28454 RepID=UPI0028AB53E8|nr:hypothetical protein [Sphingobacterium multivorum]